MNLRETLADRGYSEIKIDREAMEKGTPAIAVTASREGLRGEFTFAKINHMSDEHMADVIDSYMTDAKEQA